jgi:hypothetical protein
MITVAVDVSDNSGRVVVIAFSYWKEETYKELDNQGIPLTNGVGNVKIADVIPGLICIVEILVRNASYTTIYRTTTVR